MYKIKQRGLLFWIAALALLVAGAVILVKGLCPLEYKEAILRSSEENGIDPSLLAAIIKSESNFDPLAVSHKGAVGLMQLKPDTAAWCAEQMGIAFCEEDLFDPSMNILLGSWYYAYLYDYFGDEALAMAAYNGGMANVRKWLSSAVLEKENPEIDRIPFEETKKYVKKVNKYQTVYKILYHL